MEGSPNNSTAQEASLEIGVGKVVTVKLGDNEKTFFVANGDHGDKILPSGISEDMIPDGVMITSTDGPIVKGLMGKVEGDIIAPEKDGQGYRKLGVRVISVASLEEFLASSNSDNQRNADDKADE